MRAGCFRPRYISTVLRLCDHARRLFSPAVHIHRAEISCDYQVVIVDKQIHTRFEESSLFDLDSLGEDQYTYIDINVNDDILD